MTLPQSILTVLVIMAFLRLEKWENTRIQLEFQRQTDHLASTLKMSFAGHIQNIKAVERFFNASEYVSRLEFQYFTRDIFLEFSGIQALEWIPRISDEDRDTFEAKARHEGILSDFHIREREQEGGQKGGQKGDMVPASRRQTYFPVYFVEPLAGNEQAVGFDLASNPVRKEALDKSRDEGTMVASARITLVQENESQYGVLVFQPVYVGGVVPDGVEARRRRLQGFALGVFRIGDMVGSGLAGYKLEGIRIRLIDESAPKGAQVLFDEDGVVPPPSAIELHAVYPIDMAGRRWALRISSTKDYLVRHGSSYPALTLAVGLVGGIVLVMFLMVLTGRTFRIQEQVEQRTSELKDSEVRMKAIVETAVEAIITIDDRGHIESVNKAATELFGYSVSALIGRNVSMLMPEPHRENHNAYLRRYLETGEGRIVGRSREVEGVRRDGSRVPLSLAVSNVKLAGRRIFTGILHDLTERKRTERLKNEFVSTVSHELRTPLTSIQGSLSLVKGGVSGDLSPETLSLIDIAYRNSDRLVRLINDILDLDKMEAGKLTFHLQAQEILPLLRQALETNKAYAEQFDVALRLSKELPGAQAIVDEDRFAQIFANLFSNAAKFSPPEEPVEVAMTRENEWLLISVRDHGPGIPKSFQDKLFSKFSQLDSGNTRKTGSTGLGLAICKSIMDRMGGHITYRDAPGGGSVFQIALPEITDRSRTPRTEQC